MSFKVPSNPFNDPKGQPGRPQTQGLFPWRGPTLSYLHGGEVPWAVKLELHFHSAFAEALVLPANVVVARPHAVLVALGEVIQPQHSICELPQPSIQVPGQGEPTVSQSSSEKPHGSSNWYQENISFPTLNPSWARTHSLFLCSTTLMLFGLGFEHHSHLGKRQKFLHWCQGLTAKLSCRQSLWRTKPDSMENDPVCSPDRAASAASHHAAAWEKQPSSCAGGSSGESPAGRHRRAGKGEVRPWAAH